MKQNKEIKQKQTGKEMCVCVRARACVQVCVYVCLFPFTLTIEQNNKCNARIQVSDGVLWKYFCIKELYLRVKENHRKNLHASNCAKRVSIKSGKTTIGKRQLL